MIANNKNKKQQVNTIVIVGGGNAGWLTAGRIAAKHKTGVKVILVESPNIAPIGVGEGTWPTMRSTLIALGISETEFIRHCNVTFKQGAKFAKWVDGSNADFYYHPLVLPQGFTQGDIASYWIEKNRMAMQKNSNGQSDSFSQQVCYQEAICELGLGPKTIRTPEYDAIANYAYHLDSAKFTSFLQQHCTEKLGVTHILDDVLDVNAAENGDIASVATANNGNIFGDLFVDCSGFKSLLLGKHFNIGFKSCSDVLFIDTALAVQVPYDNDQQDIASHTISTAQEAGWIWDIGLQQRRGVGYVYSSRHSSEARAIEQLANYLNQDANSLQIKKIPIVSGHRQKFWHKNCVAVGLSAGFLEPLEASALVLVEMSAEMISSQLPATRSSMDIVAKRFNETFLYRWQKIIDFLKLHYILSKRTDNAFWTDNRKIESIPESLQELLELWQFRPPADCDFTSNNEVFPAASYQYILYGMGFEKMHQPSPHLLDNWDFAERQFEKNKQMIMQASKLPNHRQLIDSIKQFGLSNL
ncbi:tryptophan halogenase family protein [Paraferrimonas sp. SM1919]|uniref:tryptophan halogenase family protein n=1 Tax=Paraferrimonas sp. SM1919 TaxID=2662263 RepID=UPI001F094BF2|nr:tryptophan halogenase family protein [Paraferrimonas sp. SM1919]